MPKRVLHRGLGGVAGDVVAVGEVEVEVVGLEALQALLDRLPDVLAG